MVPQAGRFASLRNMPNFSVESSSIGSTQPRHARVEGSEEVCEILPPGENIGSVYCLALLFPSTGEVRYYAGTRVTVLPDDVGN